MDKNQIKGGVWKRLGDIPTRSTRPRGAGGQGQKRTSPPLSPTEMKFAEFRKKWEANLTKTKMETRKFVANQVAQVVAAERAEMGNSPSPSSSVGVGAKKENRGKEKVLRAGSGGLGLGSVARVERNSPSGSGSISDQKKKSSPIQRNSGVGERMCLDISGTTVHRVTVAKESCTKVLRDPMPQQSKTILPNNRLRSISPAQRPTGGPHKMPNSWKSAQEEALKDKNPQQSQFDKDKLQFPPMLPPLVLEDKNSSPSPTQFSSPLELQYPFNPSLAPQLKAFAWDVQRKAGASFGWFNTTNSVLNPILPGIPRLEKPIEDDVKPVMGMLTPKKEPSFTFDFDCGSSGVTISTLANQGVDRTWETPLSLRCVSNNGTEADLVGIDSSHEESESEAMESDDDA